MLEKMMGKFYRPTRFVQHPEHTRNEIMMRDQWINKAVRFMKAVICRWPRIRFTGEDVMVQMRIAGDMDGVDPRWMGLALQRAKKEGLIEEATEAETVENATLGDSTFEVPQTARTQAGHRVQVWRAV